MADLQITTQMSGIRDVQTSLKGIEDSLKRVSNANDNLRKSTSGLTKASDTLTKATNDNTKALVGQVESFEKVNKAGKAWDATMQGMTKHVIENKAAVALAVGEHNFLGGVIAFTTLGLEKLIRAFAKVTSTVWKVGKSFVGLVFSFRGFTDLLLTGIDKVKGFISKGLVVLGKALSKVGKAFTVVGTIFLKFGAALTAGITLPAVAAAGALVNFGAEADRTATLFEAKMGDMTEAGNAFVEEIVTGLGQSRTEIQTAMAGFFNFSRSLDITKEAAFSMSKALIVMGIDVSAAWGRPVKQVLSQFSSALLGGIIPDLKFAGAVTLAANVQTRGLALGLKGLKTEWSLGTTVMLRWLLIMEGAKASTGTFAAQLGNPIVQAQIFKNQIKNLSQELGQKLTPALSVVLSVISQLTPDLSGLVEKFLALEDSTRGWIIAITAGVVALGPLLLIFGGLFTVIGLVASALGFAATNLGILIGIGSVRDLPIIGHMLTVIEQAIKWGIAFTLVQTKWQDLTSELMGGLKLIEKGFLSVHLAWLLIQEALGNPLATFQIEKLRKEIAVLNTDIKNFAEFDYFEQLKKNAKENLTGIKDFIVEFSQESIKAFMAVGSAAGNVITEEVQAQVSTALGLDRGPGAEFTASLDEIEAELKKRVGEFLGFDISNLSIDTIWNQLQELVETGGADVLTDVNKFGEEFRLAMIAQIEEAIKLRPNKDPTPKKQAAADKKLAALRSSLLGVAQATNVLEAAEALRAKTMAKVAELQKEGLTSSEDLIDVQNLLTEAVTRLTEKPMKDLLLSLEENNKLLTQQVAIGKVRISGTAKEVEALEAKFEIENALAALRKIEAPFKEEDQELLEKRVKDTARLNTILKDQAKIQEAQKNLLEPFKQAAQSIQALFSDTFEELLSGGIDSFEDFAGSIKSIFIKLASEIAALMIFRPLFGNIVSGLGGSGLATSLGLPSGGFGSGGVGFPNAGNFGSRTGGGIGDFAGVGGNILGSAGSSIGNFFGTSIGFGQDTFQGGPNAGGAIPGTGFTTTIGGLAGGALMGAGVGSLVGSLTGGNSTGSTIGGALGGAAGSFFGPLGTAIGGALGGAIGGMFGGNGLPDFSFISGAITAKGNNQFGTGALNSKNASISEAQKFIQGAADALGDVVKALDIDFGGTGGLGAISKERKGFVVIKPSGGRETFDTAEKAIESFISNALSAPGAVAGQTGALIRSSLSRSGGDLNQLGADVDFGSSLQRAVENLELSDLEIELRDISEAFDEMKEEAAALGAGLPALVATLRAADFQNRLTDFNEFIRQSILGITDPLALAVEQFEKVASDRLDVAKALGADLVAVEELNALQRAQVLAQFSGQVTAILRGTFAQLASGLAAISGREALGRSLTTLQGSIAFGAAGQQSESQDLARLTSTLLGIAIDDGFATGGDRIFTKPSLISVAERGAERVSVRAAGTPGSSSAGGVTVVFDGINVIDDLSLVAFERKIQDAASKVNKGFV